MGTFRFIIKYKYLLVTVLMLIWVGVFDRYSIVTRIHDEVELHQLKQQQDYYTKMIGQVKKNRDELVSNQKTLEKFARERYFMKKDNEDVFIVEK